MRRIGKVARLPHAVREEVNQQLEGGKTYNEIIDWLTTNGHPGFNEMNISRWKDGGFQDWVSLQQQMDALQANLETAKALAEMDTALYVNAAMVLGQMHFFQAMHQLDGKALGTMAVAKPEMFLQILRAFTSFNRVCLAREQYQRKVQQEEKAEAEKNAPATNDCDPAAVREFFARLGIRPPPPPPLVPPLKPVTPSAPTAPVNGG